MRNKLRKEAGDMIASAPWNPNRELSFGDMLVDELSLRLKQGSLSPKHYAYAVDLVRKTHNNLYHIYGRTRHGLRQALEFIIRRTLNRLP